jgi:hypothetical protein
VGLILRAVDQPAPIVIAANGKYQENKENAAGLVIEKETHQQQVHISQSDLFVNDGIEQQHHRKESPEKELGEQ